MPSYAAPCDLASEDHPGDCEFVEQARGPPGCVASCLRRSVVLIARVCHLAPRHAPGTIRTCGLCFRPGGFVIRCGSAGGTNVRQDSWWRAVLAWRERWPGVGVLRPGLGRQPTLRIRKGVRTRVRSACRARNQLIQGATGERLLAASGCGCSGTSVAGCWCGCRPPMQTPPAASRSSWRAGRVQRSPSSARSRESSRSATATAEFEYSEEVAEATRRWAEQRGEPAA